MIEEFGLAFSRRRQHTNAVLRYRILCMAACLATCGFAQVNSGTPLKIPEGLEYVHSRLGQGPLSMHLVKIDRSNDRFKFTTCLAQGSVFDLQRLSQQVQAADHPGHVPVAAVNGDFFRIRSGPYQGDPLGLQILDGELVSSPGNTCFWLDAKQRPHIGPVKSQFRATWPDGTSVPFAINQELGEDGAVLYTPTMGPCTRTTQAVELVLEASDPSHWLPVQAGQTYEARIASVHQDANSVIPSNKMILSLPRSVADKAKTVTPGTVVSLSLKTSPDLTAVQTAIGGGPLLVRNGQKQGFSPNPPRHPRTAMGWNRNHFFLLVVDGRQEDLSIGVTLPELADMMIDLGCTDAMNLDGGGSSTLWLAGSVMNSPSDRQERRIANGLILLHDPAQ